MEIAALAVGFAFGMHLLAVWIRRIRKDNSYNQNIMFHGGYRAGNSYMEDDRDLLRMPENTATTYAAGPGAPVTSSFSMLRIRLQDTGNGMGYEYALKDRLTIGRYCDGSTAEIQIPDSMVSRQHCRIYRQGEQIFVQDLGSTNATFLNGCVLERVMPLTYGDLLGIGRSTYQFLYFR